MELLSVLKLLQTTSMLPFASRSWQSIATPVRENPADIRQWCWRWRRKQGGKIAFLRTTEHIDLDDKRQQAYGGVHFLPPLASFPLGPGTPFPLGPGTPSYGEPVASEMCFEFSRFWKLVVSPSPLLAKVGVDMYVMYPVVGGDVLFENADQYVP